MKFVVIRQRAAGFFLRQVIVVHRADFLAQQEEGD